MLNRTHEPVNRSIPGLGDVSGIAHQRHLAFHALPYAFAPIAARRFTPPEPPQPWAGTRDASRAGPIPPQSASRMFAALGPIEGDQSEDSLTLSIWTPHEAEAAPVMVWFHGGAFLTGAGSQAWYDGARYAGEHGVIVVCVNYRLGALGYLAMPGLSGGNLGLMDQLAALRWVRDHIAGFGGDPARVTVFGQSAGGHAIAMLLACPEACGLFQRAILQSAPMGLEPMPSAAAARRAQQFVAALGQEPREADVSALLVAQETAGAQLRNPRQGDFTPLFVPVAAAPWDGGYLPLWQAAARGAVEREVEVMIGWTRDEGALFLGLLPDRAMMDHGFLRDMAHGLCGERASEAIGQASLRRGTHEPALLCEDILTDALFRAGSLAMAETMAQKGGRAYVYRFDYAASPTGLRAAHCVDLPFVFGNLSPWHGTRILEGADWQRVRSLSDDVMARWAAFARDGSPDFGAWGGDGPREALLIGQEHSQSVQVSDTNLF